MVMNLFFIRLTGLGCFFGKAKGLKRTSPGTASTDAALVSVPLDHITTQGIESGFTQVIGQLHRVAAIRTAVADGAVQRAV